MLKIESKKILLACFDFPPNEGIGGRRWAKFAKFLAHNGHDIFVVKAKPLQNQKASNWQKDTTQKNIKKFEIARKYPLALHHAKPGLLHKLQWRIALKKARKMEAGVIRDKAIGWKDEFLNTCQKIVDREGIEIVLATGAPFNILYYAALLKEQNPKLKLLCDYRDPWLNAKTYGIPDLSHDSRKVEWQKQQTVFEFADLITAPNEYMLNDQKSSGDLFDFNTKFEVLAHAWDADDFPETQVKPSADGIIRIVYGGTLYFGITKYLKALALNLRNQQTQYPEESQKFKFDFYTEHLAMGSSIFEGLKNAEVHPPIPQAQLIALKKAADFNLILLAEHNKNFQTTKYFENLVLENPILFIGAEGAVSEGLEKDALGIVIKEFPTIPWIDVLQDEQREFDLEKMQALAKASNYKARTAELELLLA